MLLLVLVYTRNVIEIINKLMVYDSEKVCKSTITLLDDIPCYVFFFIVVQFLQQNCFSNKY